MFTGSNCEGTRGSYRAGRKNDDADATAVAMTAIDNDRLNGVAAEGHATTLRLLADRRDDLCRRTQTLNRLHAVSCPCEAWGS